MHVDLNLVWFILLGILLTGYGVLDGFDLGVGILHLFARKDEDRRIFLNSIGPLWDGNEVWLVTFAGALFAAFPNAYAATYSGFYLCIMTALMGLIFRAVSIEFRSKQTHPVWRNFWDVCFAGSSTLVAFIFGVIVGNLFLGLPIGPNMEFADFESVAFRPYAILVGFFAVAAAAMHGSIFLYLKTEGELQKMVHSWIWTSFGIFLVMYMLTTVATLVQVPRAIVNFETMPWLWIVVVLNMLAIANIPRAIFLNRPGYAFLSSICTLAALASLFGVALYPNILYSNIDPAYSLSIYSAASSQKTLGIMLIVAALGLPFVFSYTFVVYWVFHGKVQLGKFSY
jgi:cytochrome bd ubiquinol oxidase subunit II